MTRQALLQILTDKGIRFEITEHVPVFTIDEMLAANLPDPEIIAKNLFVRDDKKRNYYLITVKEDRQVNLKAFQEQFGTRKLSFASENDLMAILGVIKGAVTPFGLLNDAEKTIAASKAQLENTMRDLEQRTMINKELTRMALMSNATDKAEDIIEFFRKVAQGQSALKPNSWKELMVAIETLYPGFLEAVQGRMHRQLREPMLYTICLLKIGLKPIQIARVMDAKIQTVWNRVKRSEEICGDLLRWQ